MELRPGSNLFNFGKCYESQSILLITRNIEAWVDQGHCTDMANNFNVMNLLTSNNNNSKYGEK
jgi:hypothetical protein